MGWLVSPSSEVLKFFLDLMYFVDLSVYLEGKQAILRQKLLFSKINKCVNLIVYYYLLSIKMLKSIG